MSIGLGKSKIIGSGSFVHTIVAFTTTGATVEVDCKGLKRVVPYATPIGEPASDEVLSFNETVTNAMIDVPAGGTITLTRTGSSKTSGLKVAVLMFGY